VLLSWRGDIKLTDFGIARAAERRHKTEAGTLKGKYGYMSPEQVSSGDVDARSDLFSVGILLAEMVMARRLFTSTNDLDILLMVRDARLDRLHKYASEFPVELRVLTVRALQRRPEDRWQSAAQFRDAIDEWIRRTTRVTARDLAGLIGSVINAPTADLHGDGGVVPQQLEDNGLSGPMTRMSIAKAEAEAKAARAEFIAGEGIPQGITEFEGSSGTISVTEDDVMPESTIDTSSGPRDIGDLKETPVVKLLYRLAKSKATGMLSLEGRAGVERAEHHALAAYTALGCSGHARPDLRISTTGEVFVLEVNTLPGMTATSLLPKIAKQAGMEYATLCEQILATAT
jgi:serine/threonine protein kinase